MIRFKNIVCCAVLLQHFVFATVLLCTFSQFKVKFEGTCLSRGRPLFLVGYGNVDLIRARCASGKKVTDFPVLNEKGAAGP